MPLMKQDTVQEFFRTFEESLNAEDLASITDAANRDHDEGAEWLPWYKMSLSLLAQCCGRLSLGMAAAFHGKMSGKDYARIVNQACGDFYQHLLLCGAGPNIIGKAKETASNAEALTKRAAMKGRREFLEEFQQYDKENAGTSAIALIAAERQRQREKGYDEAHDAEHGDGSILVAGLQIGIEVADLQLEEQHRPSKDGPWPDQLFFNVQKKYAEDETRKLVIAAAMIAAEIDRRLKSTN